MLYSMVAMQRFRLVTFDITNTLLQFRSSVGSVYSTAGNNFGIQSSTAELDVYFKKNFKDMLRQHPNFGALSGMSSQVWWMQLVKKTFRDCPSTDANDYQLTQLAHYLFKAYRTSEFWAVTPGSHSLLRKLQDANVYLGVVSNFDERLHDILKEVGLRTYFDFVLASYLVPYQKPSPEMFKIALAKVDVEAKDAVHVGDNLQLDYLAARNAGWNAFLLTTKPCNSSVCKEHIVKSIPELQEKIFC